MTDTPTPTEDLRAKVAELITPPTPEMIEWRDGWNHAVLAVLALIDGYRDGLRAKVEALPSHGHLGWVMQADVLALFDGDRDV